MSGNAHEMPVTDVRDRLADVVNEAAYGGRVTYLTRHGRRLAAIVPVETAEAAERWEDEQLGLLRYRLAPEEALTEYPEWKAYAMQQLAEAGAAFLTVSANDPDLLRDVDPGRVATANRAMMSALAGWYRLIGAMRTPWTIVAVPTAGWAAKVFPDLAPAARAARLWARILEAVRVDGVSDPVEGWRRHLAELGARAAAANRARFRALHYTGPGTDLRVELPAGHRWLTSPVLDRRGIAFVPNLPTE